MDNFGGIPKAVRYLNFFGSQACKYPKWWSAWSNRLCVLQDALSYLILHTLNATWEVCKYYMIS
jgi:hypothetical protein